MFDKIFDDIVFDMIVKFTNKFAQSKVQSWVDVTIPKMKVFFALCIFISIVKLSDIYNYWRKKKKTTTISLLSVNKSTIKSLQK